MTFWMDFTEDTHNASPPTGPVAKAFAKKTKVKKQTEQQDFWKKPSPMRRWQSKPFRVQGTPFNCDGLAEHFKHNAKGNKKIFGADFVQFVIETDNFDINYALDEAISRDEAPKIIATLSETAIREAVYKMGRSIAGRTLIIEIPVRDREQILLPYSLAEAPRPGHKRSLLSQAPSPIAPSTNIFGKPVA